VHDPGATLEHEVVHESAVLRKRLGPDPGARRLDVTVTELWDQLARCVHEQVPARVADHLADTHPQVLAREPPEARRAECLDDVGRSHLQPTVALATECEHCIRPQPHGTVDSQRRVNAEEREGRVGHGVDEAVREVPRLWPQGVVAPAKRDDARLGSSAPEPCQPICVHTCAEDDVSRTHLSRRTREDDAPLVQLHDRVDLVSEEDLATGGANVLCERTRHEAVVDDAGRRHSKCAHADDMRLDLPESLLADQLEPLGPVCHAPAIQLLEPRHLLGAGRDDHLAADLGLDRPFLTVRLQRSGAVDAEAGLQRAGRVVHPGMDDAAVAAGLVLGDVGFLVEDGNPQGRMPERQGAGDRQADDPGSDNRDVDRVVSPSR